MVYRHRKRHGHGTALDMQHDCALSLSQRMFHKSKRAICEQKDTTTKQFAPPENTHNKSNILHGEATTHQSMKGLTILWANAYFKDIVPRIRTWQLYIKQLAVPWPEKPKNCPNNNLS